MFVYDPTLGPRGISRSLRNLNTRASPHFRKIRERRSEQLDFRAKAALISSPRQESISTELQRNPSQDVNLIDIGESKLETLSWAQYCDFGYDLSII